MADFTNSLQSRNPNLVERYKLIDQVITNTQTTTFTISPSPGLKDGFVRLRGKSVDASAIIAFTVSASDGSTTVVIVPTTANPAAGSGVDVCFDFHTDIAATSFVFTMNITGTTKTATIDMEVVGSR